MIEVLSHALMFLLGVALGTHYGLKARDWYYRTMQLPNASWNKPKRIQPEPNEIGYT
jgi:hypothetical protein